MLKFYYTVTANWNNIRTYATWSTVIWRDLAEFAVKNYDERKKQETKLDLDERYTLNARKWRKSEWINCCIHAKRGRVFESITKIGVSRFLIWLGWFRQSLSACMFNLNVTDFVFPITVRIDFSGYVLVVSLNLLSHGLLCYKLYGVRELEVIFKEAYIKLKGRLQKFVSLR